MAIIANCHIYDTVLGRELVHLLTKNGGTYETMCERYSFLSDADSDIEPLDISKVTCRRCKQICQEIIDNADLHGVVEENTKDIPGSMI